MEQNFNPLLYLQVARECMELFLKIAEDKQIKSLFPNKFPEVYEWLETVDHYSQTTLSRLIKEIEPKSSRPNSIWCNGVISKIRELRDMRGPNFTFRMESHGGSSSIIMIPLTLHEEFCCELTLLTDILHIEGEFNEDPLNLKVQVSGFFNRIQRQIDIRNNEMESGWYKKKIEEARSLIAKYEPAFSLPPQHVGSSSIYILSLHEELRYEIRSLIRIKCIDSKFNCNELERLTDTLQEEFQEGINKVNKFFTEINQQLEEKIHDQNSDWYNEKIAEARDLIDKHYSKFPFQPQDVMRYTKQQYPIFLSFRGEDTRYGFTRYLYNALLQGGFNVFMDDRGLERGDSISQVLMKAIENSKLSIIIFSENFANSTWCLDEVIKILECKQKKNQLVWPVFYKVEPSDVRHQNKMYGEAMTKHEARYGDDVVKNWRSALHEVCGFNAFPYKNNSGYECDFIQSIVSAATKIRDGS